MNLSDWARDELSRGAALYTVLSEGKTEERNSWVGR
jgi:hypothetical protein